jgi:flagellar biosynthesis protein FlhA
MQAVPAPVPGPVSVSGPVPARSPARGPGRDPARGPAFSVAALYHPTVLLALALMAVIVMMVLPMPAFVLDIGLAASFALAILIFTVTLFIQRPLDFSAFPTVLLASLMLRLSLNVSSTKLIIGEGHNGTAAAGHVIEGFANFIMGGSVFLGLVTFTVILIVNFIVITKGAGRMAEVGARFALDAMPGKQLAIDSDMAAGAIGHEEARERRRIEQEETTFFGSLDGASKFVKGDAVAGLLITLLNLIVGLAMGVIVHGMPASEAFSTYAILTVGDGLVTQIPAVIISVAAALLLSKGGATGSADKAVLGQLGRFPLALGTVAGLLTLFALVPGLPTLPFLGGAAVLGGLAWSVAGRNRKAAAAARQAAERPSGPPPAKKLGDMLDLDEIHLQFAPDLVPNVMDEATGLDARILNMRNHIAQSYGIIIPEIRLTDNALLPQGTYVIRIQGVEAARARLETERLLALLTEADGGAAPPGIDVAEPVYGAPARWIAPEHQDEAALAGLSVVTPTEVVATHLMEVLKNSFGRLFTRRMLRKLLDEFTRVSDQGRSEANRKLLDEFIPERVPLDLLSQVLRLLLEERVSVRNLPLILEAIAEARAVVSHAEAITEHVRHRLGFQLVAEVVEADGALPLIQLAPDWEETFQAHQIEGAEGGVDVALPPAEFNRLARSVAEKLAKAGAEGRYPAIATSTRRRRFLRTVLAAKGIRNPVLSFEEIGTEAKPALIGVA